MFIFIASCRDYTSKALSYGTRSQEISQFYLHTLHTAANGMNSFFVYVYLNKFGTKWYENHQSLLNNVFRMLCEMQHSYT